MTDPLEQLHPPMVEGPSDEFVDALRTRLSAIDARSTRVARAAWHLAQLNLGLFRAPLDSPEMGEFAAALDRINAIAEASPGFVWRLTDDDGASSSYIDVPGTDNPLLAPNLSVWTDLESLRDFMYRTDHGSYLRRRAEWFEREPQAMTVAWWVPAGTIPTLGEALGRLDHLREHGSTGHAFALTRTIPDPPENPAMTSILTQTLVPYLTVGDARRALDFYAEVFDARQSGELFEMGDGRIGHAEMTIGNHRFYLADEFGEMNLRTPTAHGGNSVSIVIHVDDCDAVYQHALAAGATGERPPVDQHGQRSGWFVDPWGHRWSPTSPQHR